MNFNLIYGIIYNDKLYTAKEAYEQNIIDLNALCVVFGIHTSGLETFNEKDYNAVKGYINNKFKEVFLCQELLLVIL